MLQNDATDRAVGERPKSKSLLQGAQSSRGETAGCLTRLFVRTYADLL